MKMLFLTTAFILLAFSSAQAGVMNFNDGAGQWQATHCAKPILPQQPTMGSEASAAQLNRVPVNFNAYSNAMHQYMECITNEAKIDTEATNKTVLNSLAVQMQQAQAELASQRAALYNRR